MQVVNKTIVVFQNELVGQAHIEQIVRSVPTDDLDTVIDNVLEVLKQGGQEGVVKVYIRHYYEHDIFMDSVYRVEKIERNENE